MSIHFIMETNFDIWVFQYRFISLSYLLLLLLLLLIYILFFSNWILPPLNEQKAGVIFTCQVASSGR